ncbi:squalene synthase HpnC [Streptomyces sp. NPDC097640]|uniref:squalene synthase HpnC n=1 Tax=Streptomyces sp. NPDC097640 TaxID=3157229 RepID=UPI003326E399
MEDERSGSHSTSSGPLDGREAARAVLDKAAHENFPVAPFFLPRAWRADLIAVYGYARLVDDIGDGDLPPGGADAELLGLDRDRAGDPLAMLDAFESDLRQVFDHVHSNIANGDIANANLANGDNARGPGDTDTADGASPEPRHPLLRALLPTVRRHRLSPEPFLGLIEANRQDQRVRRYATYEDLLGYCELSANPVGRLVLGVTGTTSPERVRLSDKICTALQIVEHLQDVAEDLRRDRVYLPAEDMKRFGVTEADLAAPTAGAPVRALIAHEAARAETLLNEGTPLVGSVHGRLRWLLAGFVAGGRAALRAVAAAGYDVLPGPPRPTKLSLLREAGATLRREG